MRPARRPTRYGMPGLRCAGDAFRGAHADNGPAGTREHHIPMNQRFRRAAVGIPGFFVFLNLYGPQSLLPLLAQEFDVTPAQISLAMTATTLAIALSAPFAGALADVLGRKRVIVAAMLLLAGPLVMTALAPSLHALIFWRFMLGLVLPPIFTVVVAYIGEEWPPCEATGMMGVYMATTSVGGFFGRFVSGLLADTIGWRNGFIVTAAVTFVCGLVVAKILPRERNFVRSEGLLASGKQMVRHLRESKAARDLCGRLRNAVQFRRAVHLHQLRARGAAVQSVADAARRDLRRHISPASFAVLWLGRAVARFGRRSLVTRGDRRCGSAASLLTLIPSLLAIIGGLAIAASCGFITQATSTSSVALTAESGRTSAIGLYATCFYVGGSVGAALPGLAWNVAGWPACVAMVVAMLVFMATVVQLAWRR